MAEFTRYAVYAVPQGGFYRKGADWLGWDSEAGAETAAPALPGLPKPAAELTATPRKYGFHGTLKPPFRLAEGATCGDLQAALADLAARLAPVEVPGLGVRGIGRFVALTPGAPVAALADLAGEAVAALEAFRAPLTEGEIARRRKSGLSPRQEALLTRWGYPYVFEEFRFHLTLTGALGPEVTDPLIPILAGHFAPELAKPYRIGDLALLGEGADGRFRLIHRYTLSR